jgi:hypothetical protein
MTGDTAYFLTFRATRKPLQFAIAAAARGVILHEKLRITQLIRKFPDLLNVNVHRRVYNNPSLSSIPNHTKQVQQYLVNVTHHEALHYAIFSLLLSSAMS